MKPHCIFIVPGDFGSVGKICSFAMGKDGAVIWDSDVHLRLKCPLFYRFSPYPKPRVFLPALGSF